MTSLSSARAWTRLTRAALRVLVVAQVALPPSQRSTAQASPGSSAARSQILVALAQIDVASVRPSAPPRRSGRPSGWRSASR